MNLRHIAEMGYTCGLDTLSEAITCAELHWDAYPPGAFEELNADIERAADNEIGGDMLCVHFLGEERCSQLDAELNAYFEEHAGDPPPEFDGL